MMFTTETRLPIGVRLPDKMRNSERQNCLAFQKRSTMKTSASIKTASAETKVIKADPKLANIGKQGKFYNKV